LQQYEAARLTDQKRVIRFCDSVVRGFSNHNPLLKLARNTGLLAFDLIPGAKQFVATYAMGLKV
jgi:2-octaprenyl-6-methoxyphenol hydroxylase